jgi:hypothetical protein
VILANCGFSGLSHCNSLSFFTLFRKQDVMHYSQSSFHIYEMVSARFGRVVHTYCFVGEAEKAMKLIGSYTSPFVRKISVILLEKGITFEFVNEQPYNAINGVAHYNPLGKVPALVTDDGEVWYDSPIIAEYIDLLGIAPAMLPADPKAALKIRQIEALADGSWMRRWFPCVSRRVRLLSNQKRNSYASAKKSIAASIPWRAISTKGHCALMR